MDRSAHRLKLAWAQRRIEELRESILEYGNSKPYRIESEKDSASGKWQGVFRVTGMPPFTDWSLMVGDAVHNMRGSLDALLFGIAQRHAATRNAVLTAEEERSIQFPICDAATAFDGQRRRLSSLPQGAVDAVEALQPYQPSQKVAHIHPLIFVRDISNFDKHRQLLVTDVFGINPGFGPGAFRKSPANPAVTELHLDDFPTPFEVRRGAFKDGDVIATWSDGPLAADFRVGEKLSMEPVIAFTEVAPESVSLRKVSHIKHVRAWIEERVLTVLEPFLI